MGASLLILFFLPWLDRSPVKSIRYRSPIYKWVLGVFVVSFIMLGWLGMEPVTPLNVFLARVFTILYFAFFILMPWYTSIGKTKEVPERADGVAYEDTHKNTSWLWHQFCFRLTYLPAGESTPRQRQYRHFRHSLATKWRQALYELLLWLSRYEALCDTIALLKDLNLSDSLMAEHLMFAGDKPGETITTAMPEEGAAKWFGVTPPDLSLVARSKGTDWIYSYLRSFYKDGSKVFGVNNKVLENASMPDVLWSLKEEQI